MRGMGFEKRIEPFSWLDHGEGLFSLTLYTCFRESSYKDEVFATRADEGFAGTGYDWDVLSYVFLEEKLPELKDKIEYDSENNMFCVYSRDKEALQKFALEFKAACEDDTLIKDLFSRAKSPDDFYDNQDDEDEMEY
jgi:hypothetical protein